MLVANSFDLWQKDTFFAAAEEVQQSADIMESAYRAWLRAKREGLMHQHLEELGRKLQMALGTAKWQLEEFEKAVHLSYRSHGNDSTISRHRQFVSSMEEQIFHVETALKESFDVEGKKPFRWVNLNKEECDDLALFLSGSSLMPQSSSPRFQTLATSSLDPENNSLGISKLSLKFQLANQEQCLQEAVTSNEAKNCLMEQEESRYQETDDRISYHADRNVSTHRTWVSQNQDLLEIVIDRDDRPMNAVIETTPKEKVTNFKPFFWGLRGEEHAGKKGLSGLVQLKMFNWINQGSAPVYSNFYEYITCDANRGNTISLAVLFTCFTAPEWSALFGLFGLKLCQTPSSICKLQRLESYGKERSSK